MSQESQESASTDAAPSPFTMVGGAGVVCEGDACLIPGAVPVDPAR